MNMVEKHFSQVASVPPLRASRITKEYLGGSFKALEDVSFELQENQITAFIGPSGCGKTTMLRIIAGLEYPTRGRLQVFGKNVEGPGPDRGMIFQAYTSFPWLTAMQNVEYGMKILNVPARERRERTMNFLKLVHLENFANSYPRSLSGGMKQRVALARTLAQNPAILLMDEPFGALDAQVRWEMQELMIELIEREKKPSSQLPTTSRRRSIWPIASFSLVGSRAASKPIFRSPSKVGGGSSKKKSSWSFRDMRSLSASSSR